MRRRNRRWWLIGGLGAAAVIGGLVAWGRHDPWPARLTFDPPRSWLDPWSPRLVIRAPGVTFGWGIDPDGRILTISGDRPATATRACPTSTWRRAGHSRTGPSR